MGEDGSRPKKRRSNDLPLSDQTQAKLQRRNPVSDGGRTRTPQHSILRVSFVLFDPFVACFIKIAKILTSWIFFPKSTS